MTGELQRAFYGARSGNGLPLFAHCGMPLRVPGAGGSVDPDNEVHDLIVPVFAGVSKGGRRRLKARVHASMPVRKLMEEPRTRTAGARSTGEV
ncbi:hypothetical protein [Streptomyces sp. KMM 9044]|uniref:hypothetical protein n=1 Tax=Streptomyces sp. KMM 9044 TaxID=2744474 RepID=UPI002151CD65|nr:hypothetical protein [Streptomyces sp. KMM 9044]WAX77444.1 hypothetical protein HUV60_007005 [Streptomyces sp. KMM 9044]